MRRTPSAAERLALLRLARTQGVGPVAWRKLLDRHGGGAAALAALPPGTRVPDADTIAREVDAVAQLGGRFLLLDEPDYPEALAALGDAPPALAVLGDAAVLARPAIAIVGARNASANGRRFAEALAGELMLAGVVVVSGLARGIDTAAHRGALAGGHTVAAIPGGLDQPYPPENVALQAEIAARGGAVVSEVPLGTVPTNRHFPRRNRIIAGLALGCVVVEAAPRSGSLITARLTLDAGRELFAVPGSPLEPRCRGSNDLLRQGVAHLCEGLADIVAHVALELAAASPRPRLQPARIPAATPDDPGDAILALLGPDPSPIDDLVRRCQFSASAVAAVLAELEMAGRVQTLPGARVCLRTG